MLSLWAKLLGQATAKRNIDEFPAQGVAQSAIPWLWEHQGGNKFSKACLHENFRPSTDPLERASEVL